VHRYLLLFNIQLLDKFYEHIAAQLLLLWHERYSFFGRIFHREGRPVRFTRLHEVAYLRIVELVAGLLVIKK